MSRCKLTIDTKGVALKISAAFDKLDNSSGGSSGTSITTLIVPFTFETVGLNEGLVVYEPQVHDLLLGASFFDDVAWDGTTPTADIGLEADTNGIFAEWFGAVPLDRLQGGESGSSLNSPRYSYVDPNTPYQTFADLATTMLVYDLGGSPTDPSLNISDYTGYGTMHRFVSTEPLMLWASQDGARGGEAVDSTQGASFLVLVIARPTLIAT